MKVTLINTADAGGGAPEACMRLLKALQQQHVDVRMIVQEKKTGNGSVQTITNSLADKVKYSFNLLYERLPFIWFKAKDKSLRFAFSIANTGTDISEEPIVKEADILHIHWTNFGFLSIKDLSKLLETGKPIVWTLHDMWAFTGGCHYSGDCDHFINHCGNCWMLRDAGVHDRSYKNWNEKMRMLQLANNIAFVTCSKWLADVAATSSLLNEQHIQAIPNPIDTNLFSPVDKTIARNKFGIDHSSKVILFGAANILDRRKGIKYLTDALDELKLNFKTDQNIQVVIFGKNKGFDIGSIPFKVHEAGIITKQEDMASLYNAADIFVNPSIEDNLPNTIMESLACGIPVVAFNTGGIPDMVDHKQNGYLAKYKSAADLAAGINYVLENNDYETLAENARNKVINTFTNDIVAAQYLAVYNSLLSK